MHLIGLKSKQYAVKWQHWYIHHYYLYNKLIAYFLPPPFRLLHHVSPTLHDVPSAFHSPLGLINNSCSGNEPALESSLIAFWLAKNRVPISCHHRFLRSVSKPICSIRNSWNFVEVKSLYNGLYRTACSIISAKHLPELQRLQDINSKQ